ncbi:hypothetical protein RUM43_008895 [Polyplax serrata]|uniref:HSF-type DNA-binding domain-containing protein n=1 Tax=Polyplax serrata TaxID=468196 RepID=A0AAN8S1N3_POLSC
MYTAYKPTSDSGPKKKGNLLSMGDEDFYVLKFPQKLWRIVNECNTGAIQWGIYGKTILIDYNLFQAQYLECEIPKFKTRNMTSFVRQLNMYGFKKMQTQVKNDSSRCCNIHEFFHNCFRFGRSDLLDNVKRRPTPLKNTRVVQNLEYHNQSRLHLCRAAFAKALQKSRERMHQESREFAIGNNGGEPKNEPQEEFNFQVIPIENSLKDQADKADARKTLTIEVSSEFQDYIDMNPDFQDFRTESENSSIEDLMFENQDLELSSLGAEDHSLHFFDQAPLIENEKDYFVDINETSVMRGNHSVQVKKGFDGTNYVIDLMVGCSDEKNVENVVSKVLETELFSQESAKVETQASECLIVINSSPTEEKEIPTSNLEVDRRHMCESNSVEEFYDSITTYLGL